MVTSYRLADDAAYPSGNQAPDSAAITVGYIGGDAAHVWSNAEWNFWNTTYRIPVWVRSNPSSVNPVADAMACIKALQTIGAPPPYFVLPYGSIGYIFNNPECSGYWVADPTGVVHLYIHDGVVATQYAFDGTFDISEVLDSVPIWNCKTGTGPTSIMLDLETAVDPTYVSYFNAVLTAYQGSMEVLDMPEIQEGNLDPGLHGPVRKLQTWLNLWDSNLVVDGDFGRLTKTAVENVQRILKISVDGVVGPQTWGALANAT